MCSFVFCKSIVLPMPQRPLFSRTTEGYWVHVTLSGILKEKTERFNQFGVRTPKYTMKIMGQFFRFL